MQNSSDSIKSITIRCEGAATQPLDRLKVLQGGLKKLSKANLARLKARITDAGFCGPFFIWDTAGALMILDGTQRRAALLSLEAEGWTIPPLPVVYIHAETEAKAREILLSVSSQYGEWVEEELAEWMGKIDASIKETLRLTSQEIIFDVNVPIVQNDINAKTSKAGQYDKTKMPINIGALLFFLSRERQIELSETGAFDIFYHAKINDETIRALCEKKIKELADEICAILSAE